MVFILRAIQSVIDVRLIKRYRKRVEPYVLPYLRSFADNKSVIDREQSVFVVINLVGKRFAVIVFSGKRPPYVPIPVVKPLGKRDNVSAVVVGYRVGGFDLFGASYDIRKYARNRLSFNKVAALVKDYAVIIKPVFVNEFRNVISVSP